MSVPIDQLLCLPLAVDPREGLLVEEPDEAVPRAIGSISLHRDLLVVGPDVRLLEDRRELVLAGGDLVVAGLDRDAELERSSSDSSMNARSVRDAPK